MHVWIREPLVDRVNLILTWLTTNLKPVLSGKQPSKWHGGGGGVMTNVHGSLDQYTKL